MWDGVICMVTRLRARWFRVEILTFLSNPICTDWLCSLPNSRIEWMPGALCTRTNWPGREAVYSPSSTADDKNVWRYMSNPAIWLHTLYRNTFIYLKYYLNVQYMYCHSQVVVFCTYVLGWQHFVRMCAVDGWR